MNKEILENTATSSELKIDMLQLKKAALILRAVNHKLRQQMLKLIHLNNKMTVTEIYVKLRLEQSVASQHLAILRKAGFVTTVRDGKFIFYSVNYKRLDQVHSIVNDLLK
ncbi:MAG: helix-turn-helix transcriptional regulator [Flavisolibacter sp.]|jgi:DNA-binding transcriptional ArsR family regulator|nr:helix-turn-helix transcriptional regulator [Flavisolibacter sp.]